MSLQSRIATLITAIGTDIKALQALTPTILDRKTAVNDTQESIAAVEWRNLSSTSELLGKLVTINPIVSAVIVNRSELWTRVKSRDGTSSADRLILDSDGKSDFMPPIRTTLFAPASDGQEITYLPDPNNTQGNGNVAWLLKYRASDSKWYFIGGPPLHVEVAAEESIASTAYGVLSTAGPSITIPLLGDYIVEQGAAVYTAGVNSYIYMSYAIGATAASDLDALEMRGTGTGNLPQMAGSRRKRKTGLAAGTVLASRYRASVTSAAFKNRWMAVTPLRIG